MPLKEQYPYYLGGESLQPNAGLDVTNKYTQKVACRCALADEETVTRAITMAADTQATMAALSSYERRDILLSVASQIRTRLEELSEILCVEAGKPLKDSRGEVSRAIDTFTIAAEEATRIYGEYVPLDINPAAKGMQGIVRKFPNGPVAMISPFNFPVNLAAHKIAPAIAAGCSFVLKPASVTPISSLILGEMLAVAGMPPGTFSVLPCSRAAGNLLVTDPRLKVLSFTGSDVVGYKLKQQAYKKKVVLELGGNAACVVDAGSDVAHVVNRLITGAFYQSGQSCISVQRIYVHDSIYTQVRDALGEKAAKLIKGDPLDEKTFLGPLISEKDAVRLEEWTAEAVKGGANVVCGGTRQGPVLDATVVENVPRDAKLNRKEAFGPVATIEPFSDFKTVIAKINDSDFGLQAGVFTSDLNKAFYAYENLEVGGVVINDIPSVRVDSQAYGGVKDSGCGREGIRYAIEDMCEIKIMLMKGVGQL